MKQFLRLKAILRSVAWPYDVFKRNDAGGILYDTPAYTRTPAEPVVDPIATLTAKILSLIAAVTALNVAIEEATGYGLRDLFDWIF